MEQDWGRGDDYLHLSLEDVNERIFPLEATLSELIQEGKANTNYRLELSDGRLGVLRLYQRSSQSAALERSIANLFEAESWMPKIYAFGPDFTLSEFKPGQTMQSLAAQGQKEQILSAAKDLGRALATISSVQFESPGFLNQDLEVTESWPTSIDGYLGYLDTCLDRKAFLERMDPKPIKDRMHSLRSRFLELSGPPCLVHGDFKASNILIHDGHLSAVLDWEFAHSGSWLMSTGQILRHPSELPQGFADEFATKDLPRDWIQLSKAMDVVNLVDFLGRESSTEEQIEQVSRLIEANLRMSGLSAP